MNDLISRQAAIDALDVLCQEHRYKIPGKIETYSQYNEAWQDALDRAEGAIFNLPSAQPEPLTDKEQRIFLAAMGREEKVCKQVAEECMELAHACIKAARKLRGESYTPVDRTTLSYKLHEETADVINSIDVLHYNGTLDYDMVSEIANAKMARWSERVAMRSQ